MRVQPDLIEKYFDSQKDFECPKRIDSQIFLKGNLLLRVRPDLIGEKDFDSKIVLPCDVSSDNDIKNLFPLLAKEWGKFDVLVHSIAFVPREALSGDFIESTTRENFTIAHNISSFSFTALAKEAVPYLNKNASLLTLSYLGAERTMPNYNVMGLAKASLEANVRYMAHSLGTKNIRVNAISAGPIKTLAASGIGDFRYILKWNQYNSPLRRNVTLEDVGGCGVYLLSNLSAGVTGETHHVDCGFHVVGMKAIDAPDMSPEKKRVLIYQNETI